MEFLRELCDLMEQLDGLPTQQEYVLSVTPTKKKKKRKTFPTSDATQDNLINYLWANQNSDAV